VFVNEDGTRLRAVRRLALVAENALANGNLRRAQTALRSLLGMTVNGVTPGHRSAVTQR